MQSVKTSVALAGLLLLAGLAATGTTARAQTVQVGAARAEPASGAGWIGIRSTMTIRFDIEAGASTDALLRVDDVYRDGPAWRAGLRAGDLVVGLNGRPLRLERFQSLAARLLPGDPVSLTVLRDGRELEFSVEAARRPGVEVLAPRQIQETLDSTRRVFLTRLDSVHVALSGGVAAPRVELRRIEADSIQTVEVRSEGTLHRLAIRTADGLFEWTTDTAPADSLSPRSFTAWVFRTDDDPTGARPVADGDSIRLVTRVAPPAGRVAAGSRSGPVGTVDESTAASARPLAPYLAGMNRVAGAEFTPLVDDLATYFQADEGLLVTDVAEGTPAADAGLAPGDVIVGARGRPVGSIEQLRAALSLRDGPAVLSVVRRGRRVELKLQG